MAYSMHFKIEDEITNERSPPKPFSKILSDLPFPLDKKCIDFVEHVPF